MSDLRNAVETRIVEAILGDLLSRDLLDRAACDEIKASLVAKTVSVLKPMRIGALERLFEAGKPYEIVLPRGWTKLQAGQKAQRGDLAIDLIALAQRDEVIWIDVGHEDHDAVNYGCIIRRDAPAPAVDAGSSALYRIGWRSRVTDFVSHGSSVPEQSIDASLADLNARYPEIYHYKEVSTDGGETWERHGDITVQELNS